MDPITREEKLMAGEQLEPITRKEYFLAKAAGMDVETPEPITREEMFLSMISGGGTGGSGGGGSGGGDDEWFNDGDTHIWITLQDGRTSPMLGVCPKGTVTVDWGDGTEPDTLTGTSTSTVQWTPNHNYAEPGNYIIRLSVDGEMGFKGSNPYPCILRYGSLSDSRNYVYQNSVTKIEMGIGVTSIGERAFYCCYSLASITIPVSVTSIGSYAFSACYSLTSITIPDSVTSIGESAFSGSYSLASITIPDSVTIISENMFGRCYSLASIVIPDGVTSIGGKAFNECYGIRYYDFSSHTAAPALSATNAFTKIPSDCEIRVPAALYDEWIAATNWATYASQIVAV